MTGTLGACAGSTNRTRRRGVPRDPRRGDPGVEGPAGGVRHRHRRRGVAGPARGVGLLHGAGGREGARGHPRGASVRRAASAAGARAPGTTQGHARAASSRRTSSCRRESGSITCCARRSRPRSRSPMDPEALERAAVVLRERRPSRWRVTSTPTPTRSGRCSAWRTSGRARHAGGLRVPGPVLRGAPLGARAARARVVGDGGGFPGRARGDGDLRLRGLRPVGRARRRGGCGAGADLDRPPPLQRRTRHDPFGGSRRVEHVRARRGCDRRDRWRDVATPRRSACMRG